MWTMSVSSTAQATNRSYSATPGETTLQTGCFDSWSEIDPPDSEQMQQLLT